MAKKNELDRWARNAAVGTSAGLGFVAGGSGGAGVGAGVGMLLGGPPGAAVGYMLGLVAGGIAGAGAAGKAADTYLPGEGD